MNEIVLAPAQLARLVEYGEVTVYVQGEYARLKVRNEETAPPSEEDGAVSRAIGNCGTGQRAAISPDVSAVE